MAASLDPMPSDARLRELARIRQVERFGRLLDPALEARAGVKRARATGELHRPPPPPSTVYAWGQVDRGDQLALAIREGHTLRLTLLGPPRTKKNHGRAFGIKQSVAYCRYRGDIVDALAPHLKPLELPLPEIAYNCSAVFFVDRYGEPADLNGLNQGLHDALQDAGVIVDDWWIRAVDGTRIVFGDLAPRVELAFTPLLPPIAQVTP